MTSLRLRHYIVQILFEELGTRNHRLIHSDIFLDTIESIGIESEIRRRLIEKYLSQFGFDSLISTMNEAENNSEILGILLGLEIDANENIQTVFNSLAFDAEIRFKIQNDSFFKIHRIAEDEHIRLDVANFLRFCRTSEEKDEFISGFDKAVKFWRGFWSAMVNVIDEESIQ